ncbi:MAG: bacterioferritin [Colwellia sp.]|nr:bacterioferritin [Colwellia sp.]
MQGNKDIITLLNKALAIELIAINQYFLHARMYKNWGLESLNKADYKMSILKMKQADNLIERILFLEGLPNLQELGRLHIGENTEEMLQSNLELEHVSHSALKTLIEKSELEQDYISRNLAKKLLANVEEQIDWIDDQKYFIKTAGIENFTQSKT